ncbi:MAG: insulinase family protein [Myxococcales bacterium]|jgi:predicted Zn-dependent peptidase|nr:insulinase family protein [Myxococcales bacterium]
MRRVEHIQETLSCGLRVVVVPQPWLSRAHVGFYARTGSRYEDKRTNGLSHFLEHMLYRGTPRLSTAHDVNLAVENLGGYLYAVTQVDFGVFSVTMPPESLEPATLLFGEILREPTFADIELEKGIVREEILEDLDDEGRQVDADNLSRALIYPKHPLGYSIVGTHARVAAFDHDMLVAHHQKHYAATSSVLVFSGAVDPARALDAAERAFAGMRRGGPIVAEPPVHAQTRARLKMVESMASQTELRVCFRAPSESSPERPAIDMLLRILDDGMSTRLYHRLVDDKGLLYDVSAAYDGYEDDGIVDFAASCVHERTPAITRQILDLVVELAREGPTEAELDKARRRNEWESRFMLDSVEETASFFAGGVLFDRFQLPWDRVAENARVTRDDVREVARAIARPDRLSVVAVGLLEQEKVEAELRDVVKGYAGA